MKFDFKATHEDGSIVQLSFEAVLIDDVLEELYNFLRGCGYELKGTIEVVE